MCHGRFEVSVASCIGGRALMEDHHAVSLLHMRPLAGSTSPSPSISCPTSPPGHHAFPHQHSSTVGQAYSIGSAARPAKVARLEVGPHAVCPTASTMANLQLHSASDDDMHSASDGGGEGHIHDSHAVLCAAVYDGHSGSEVARYAAQHLPALIAHSASSLWSDGGRDASGNDAHSPGRSEFQDGSRQEPAAAVPQYVKEEACRRAFMQLDAQLADPRHAHELYHLSHGNRGPEDVPPVHYGWWVTSGSQPVRLVR